MNEKLLDIGACGWTHPEWSDDYYPDDLPEDWRLGFYQHSFRFVVVSMNDWLQADKNDVDEWLEELREDFSFFLALDQATWSSQHAAQLERMAGLLQNTLEGLLVYPAPGGVDAKLVEQLKKLATVYVDSDCSETGGGQPVWRPGREGCEASFGIVDAEQVANIRNMREHMQALLQQHPEGRVFYLAFEGRPPAIKSMQDARVIAEMLV